MPDCAYVATSIVHQRWKILRKNGWDFAEAMMGLD